MFKMKVGRILLLSGLSLFIGTSLVSCENQENPKTNVETSETNGTTDQEIFFEERPVKIDYSLSPEEILANYTEKGMNTFKVNFPDTLTMNYALKHIGQVAPEVEGKTVNGETVKLSDLKGKNVIISFSKTTCSVCMEMAPIQNDILVENQDIVFLHVFPVDQNQDINAFYQNLKLEIPANTLSLENNPSLKDLAVNTYHIEQVPTYVFVDDSGRIAYTYIGNKDKILFQDMINTAFGKEKLYDLVRTVTIRVDKNGNEIIEKNLIDEKKINEDGIDHTEVKMEAEESQSNPDSKEKK